LTIQYVPEPGYFFHRWQTEGEVAVSNPNANPTTMTIRGDGALRVIYGRAQLPPSVGGLILPTNPFTALAPFVPVIGLLVTTAIAVNRKRRT